MTVITEGKFRCDCHRLPLITCRFYPLPVFSNYVAGIRLESQIIVRTRRLIDRLIGKSVPFLKYEPIKRTRDVLQSNCKIVRCLRSYMHTSYVRVLEIKEFAEINRFSLKQLHTADI